MSYTPPVGDNVIVDVTEGPYTPPYVVGVLVDLANVDSFSGAITYMSPGTLPLTAPEPAQKFSHLLTSAGSLTLTSSPVTYFSGAATVADIAELYLVAQEPDMVRSAEPPSAELTLNTPQSSQRYKVRNALSSAYHIVNTVYVHLAAPYAYRTGRALSSLYALAGNLQKAVSAPYSVLSYDKVIASLRATYGMSRAGRSLTSAYSVLANSRVSTSIASPYSFAYRVVKGLVAAYYMNEVVTKAVAARYGINNFNKVLCSKKGIYSIQGDTQVISTSDQPYILVDGLTQVAIVSGDVSTSEGGFAWECNLVLANMEDYARFQRDTPFTVNLYGDVYSFITDGKELSRTEPAGVEARIMGISPSAVYASPRAALQDYLWETDAFAKDIVEDALGFAISWGVVDWKLPAYRVSFTRSSPMDVLRKLAEVVGGVVESSKSGVLRVRPLFPVSTPQYATATPAHVYVEAWDILSVSENYAYDGVYNTYRLLDVDSVSQDTIEWEPSEGNPYVGLMRAYPFPWRTNVSLTHTGDSGIAIGSQAYAELETEELVEIFEGQGNTKNPIFSITGLTWLATNLGGLVYATDSKELTVTGTQKNSVARIKYKSRSLEYPIATPNADPAQFLLESPIP